MRAWIAGILVVMTSCGRNGAAATRPPEPAALPGIVAHRGASVRAPENTLAALRLAWELGAESSEIDVRVTADGEVVLMHDADTKRTGGRARPVVEQTLAELRELDVGSWKSPDYRGERVPTLYEAIEATPPGRMLFVEIKTSAADAERIAAVIRDAAAEKRGAVVALQAYDPDALAAVGERVPGVETYWTVDPPRTDEGAVAPYPAEVARFAAERRFTGVAVHHAGVDDAFATAVRDAGLALDVWTVNEAAQLAHWRPRARWVETDRPELATR